MPKQKIDAKHANMSIDVSSKGVWLENITRNLIIKLFISACTGRGRGMAHSQVFLISVHW